MPVSTEHKKSFLTNLTKRGVSLGNVESHKTRIKKKPQVFEGLSGVLIGW